MVGSSIVEKMSPLEVLSNNPIGYGIELNPEIQAIILFKNVELRLRSKNGEWDKDQI